MAGAHRCLLSGSRGSGGCIAGPLLVIGLEDGVAPNNMLPA